MAIKSGARYLAEALEHVGVTHVFFMDAILRRTLVELEQVGVKRVLGHSEKAVAYMADGYARASGRVGVCMAQSVGAANLAAGLQDAYLHRAPVLALTGRKQPTYRYRNAYQEVRHGPLFEPVTKMRAEVEVGDELPLLLAQALRAATDRSPRPVHLDLNGLQAEVIEAASLTDAAMPDPALARIPARRTPCDPRAVATAAERIAAASRPVLVVGTGAVQAGAHEAVLALAEQLDIPVATSLGGRGIIDTRHPRSIGVIGTYSAPVSNQVTHEADLVIFVGCHTGDQVTNNWTVPGPNVAVVQIDVDGEEIGRNYPNVTGVLGDPEDGLRGLLEQLIDRFHAAGGWRDWAQSVERRVAAWRAEMAPLLTSDEAPTRVERVCAEITRALPRDGILVADTGYSGIWTGTLIDLAPGQSYLRAAGSLGWSFPAALGAKLAAPERAVICFCGDGGFYYHLPELETARRWNIPVVVVVNNNSGFAQGLVRVRKLYEGTNGNPDETSRFGPTDFAAVARAFGVEGMRVRGPGELGPALERALGLGAPVVIDVETDAESRAPEAWTPPG
ncbi:MAG: thiamine pyrophosphate-binding protein [Chromatiales bacterium]|nr:thiamine pyrophosphate-binding protein [Chromatiales bacterium]